MGEMPDAESLSPERRARILEGAALVFARDGYEGASMAGIAREAAVSKGTLYNYYPGKSALFGAHIERCARANLERIFDFPAEETDPATVLRRIGRAMVTMFLSPPARDLYRVVTAEATKFPEMARTFFAAGPEQGVRRLAAWLAGESGAGRLAVGDAEFAAEQFLALCQTRLALRYRLFLIERPAEAEIERVIEGAIAMFLDHYAPPPRAAAPQEAERDG